MFKALRLSSDMEKKLTLEEQPAFREISFSIGREGSWHTLDDVRGVPIPKNAVPLWMKLFVEKGFYMSREDGSKTEYQITYKGLDLFEKLKVRAEKEAQPVPFQYPRAFKGTKTSYYP